MDLSFRLIGQQSHVPALDVFVRFSHFTSQLAFQTDVVAVDVRQVHHRQFRRNLYLIVAASASADLTFLPWLRVKVKALLAVHMDVLNIAVIVLYRPADAPRVRAPIPVQLGVHEVTRDNDTVQRLLHGVQWQTHVCGKNLYGSFRGLFDCTTQYAVLVSPNKRHVEETLGAFHGVCEIFHHKTHVALSCRYGRKSAFRVLVFSVENVYPMYSLKVIGCGDTVSLLQCHLRYVDPVGSVSSVSKHNI